MTADDADVDYGNGNPDIDTAVRQLVATFPPLSAAQRATVATVYNRAADRSAS